MQNKSTIRDASRTNFRASEIDKSMIFKVSEIFPKIIRIRIARKVERS